MLEKGEITLGQLFILVLMFDIGTSILLVPSLIVVEAKHDAWIGTLLGISMGLLLTLLYGALAKRYPTMNLIELNESILGKWIGKVLSLLFFFYFYIQTAGLLRIIGDFITTHIMPETPILAIEIIFIVTVIYGVRLGLEPFSRTAEVVIPWVIGFFFLLVFFLFPVIETKNMLPIMEDGIKPILKAGLLTLGIPFADVVIFLMLIPNVVSPNKIGRILFFGTLTGGFIIFTFVLLSILVLGQNQTAKINYPIYVLAQKVNIGNFIQRIEILAGGMVFISIFFKTIISFYSTTLSFAQFFNLKKYKMLTFPFGIIIIILANLMSPDIIFFHSFLSKTWITIALIYGGLFPMMLLVIDTAKTRIKKRKMKFQESR